MDASGRGFILFFRFPEGGFENGDERSGLLRKVGRSASKARSKKGKTSPESISDVYRALAFQMLYFIASYSKKNASLLLDSLMLFRSGPRTSSYN